MAKKKEEKVETVGTAEAKAKFQEKLKELLALGRKKKNILEYQEISILQPIYSVLLCTLRSRLYFMR